MEWLATLLVRLVAALPESIHEKIREKRGRDLEEAIEAKERAERRAAGGRPS